MQKPVSHRWGRPEMRLGVEECKALLCNDFSAEQRIVSRAKGGVKKTKNAARKTSPGRRRGSQK